MLPFEFIVMGPPLSHQSHNKVRLAGWRNSVRQAAIAAWPLNDPVLAEPLELTVWYLHDGPAVIIDNDNLVKPIQDALNAHIYADDHHIVATHVHKRPLDGQFYVRHMSPVLANGFVIGQEFIWVRIAGAAIPGHFHGN